MGGARSWSATGLLVCLSKTTIPRDKQTGWKESLGTIQKENENILLGNDGFWILFWDETILKPTTCAGKKRSELAAVLIEIYLNYEILHNVIDVTNETGSEAETKKLVP